jgi:DNA-binding IclR family transcriptional regulator
MEDVETGQGSSLQRGFAVIRVLAATRGAGARLTAVARETGLPQATTHRILRALVAEGVVEQAGRHKSYRLSLAFFGLAARAGDYADLRALCRPVMLRLSGSLNDTVFLLVRSGFDAICLDRVEGPFPIRSFTGDIGGRIALGVGQASLAILASLPEEEREEIIRFNVPRLRHLDFFDESYLRTEITRARAQGYAANSGPGLIAGMAGVAVPVLNNDGFPVAALSIGTLSERLNDDRLPSIVQMLKKEAVGLGARVNTFDPTLRWPSHYLGGNGEGAPGRVLEPTRPFDGV